MGALACCGCSLGSDLDISQKYKMGDKSKRWPTHSRPPEIYKKIFFLDLRRVVGGRSVWALPQELGELPLKDGREEALVVNEVRRAHSVVSQLGGSRLPAQKRLFGDATLIKKENQIFLIYKEIQSSKVIYEEGLHNI